MLSNKDPKGRLELDAWTGKKNTAEHLLFVKSVDEEVEVTIPGVFLAEAAREKVDAHCGVGTYDGLRFNPNNQERIALPWTKKEVCAIFCKVVLDYRKMMYLYTKGTGGGDGDPVAYSVWEKRDALCAVTYSDGRTPTKVHLSVVHCWDKEFGFPLTIVKGTVPAGSAVDDDNEVSSATRATPFSYKSQASKDQLALVASLKLAAEERRRGTKETFDAMQSVIRSLGDGGDEMSQTDRQIQLQKAIESTFSQLAVFQRMKTDLKREKRAISSSGEPKDRKKLKIVDQDIGMKSQLIKQYRNTLQIHIRNLEEVNGQGNLASDGDSDSDASSV